MFIAVGRPTNRKRTKAHRFNCPSTTPNSFPYICSAFALRAHLLLHFHFTESDLSLSCYSMARGPPLSCTFRSCFRSFSPRGKETPDSCGTVNVAGIVFITNFYTCSRHHVSLLRCPPWNSGFGLSLQCTLPFAHVENESYWKTAVAVHLPTAWKYRRGWVEGSRIEGLRDSRQNA